MSIGSPVRGDADVVGGAGIEGAGPPGPGFKVGGGATAGFGLAVVDVVAARVVVVVGLGLVVVVVDDVDVVVVGAGLTVSTRRRSVPQALPRTRRSTTSTLRRGGRWCWGLCAVMSTADGTGSMARTGGPRTVGREERVLLRYVTYVTAG